MAVDVFARTLALASLGNGGGGSAVDTYTKAEINKMIGDLETIQVELVDQLPTFEDAKNNVIYLVPVKDKPYHEEWMIFKSDEPESGGFWEQIGTTEIDMSQYSTTEELQEMMVQELAKYITSTDFTEALKNYATKDYAESLIIGNKHIVTFTNTNKNHYAMTNSQNVEFFNFVKDVLNPAVDKYGPENIIVILSSMISSDIKETLGLYLWDERSQVYSQPYENLSISEVNNAHHWAVPNWYSFSLDISSGKKALSHPVQPPYIEFFDLDYDYKKPYMPKFDGSPATKKYVDDTVAAIEIPSIEGLATEEYADAAGQKAFDDMVAIAGNIDDLTTETHETFTAAINEINDKVNNIEIPSADLSKYATKQDVQDAIYEIDEDRDMKKYFVTDYGVYYIFTLDFIEGEETYYTVDSELGMAIQDIMNDFAANSGHESSCVIIINDIYRNAFKLYVNRPGMSLTTISPVEFLEDGYIHRIECADVNIFDNEARFSDVGYILKTSKTKLSADVDLTGYATETYVNEAVANATSNVNVFEGTQEEYDALSDEEKAKYTIVVIDDGEEV